MKELQTLIKKESTMKELCKKKIYVFFTAFLSYNIDVCRTAA